MAIDSTISTTYWDIEIGINLQQDTIFTVNKFITSNPPCNVYNAFIYMTLSVLDVVVFVGLVPCIS